MHSRNVDNELEEHKLLSNRKSEFLTFDRYYRYDEIVKYMHDLEKSSKASEGAQVSVKTVGKSFEGREIKTITITNGDGKKKNSVFVDAGIHAREWIAPATALYLINQLVDPQSNYSKILNELDFVIQPVVNPDGYEYTFVKSRLWRKTRSSSSSCVGVDANRNYGFEWSNKGASDKMCSETYHGTKPFSEKEAQISRDIMQELSGSCKFFLTLHSYGNYFIYPYGYTNDLPENWKDQDEVSQAGAKAIEEATGTRYKVGSISNTLYIASGGSTDYAYAEAKIPIALCMELTGGGWFGFDLPASKVEATVKESIAGIFAMADVIAKKYN